MTKGITGKLILAFVVLLVVISVGLIALTLQTAYNYTVDAESTLMLSVSALDDIIQTKEKEVVAIAEVFSTSNQLLNGILNKNTAQLSTFAKPIYDGYQKATGLSVFEIGGVDGKVIYRAHNPSQSGDDKFGYASVTKALSGEAIAGIDTGYTGLGIRAFYPIKSIDKVIGTLQVGYSKAFLDSFKNVSDADVDVYTSASLVYTTHDEKQELIGSAVADQNATVQKNIERALAGERFLVKETSVYYYYQPIFDPTDTKVLGAIAMDYDISAVNQRILNMFYTNGAILAAIIVFVIALVTYFLKAFVNPVKLMSEEISLIADYNLSSKKLEQNPKLLAKSSEIGVIAKATHHMRESLVTLISSISSDAEHVSSSSEELTATSEQSSLSAEEVAKTIMEIANGASEQAKQTSDGAHEIERLGDLIAQERTMVDRLKSASDKVDTLKNEGFGVLHILQEKTKVNTEASEEVAKIILETSESVTNIEQASTMIKSIADQTNLLALNAAIEAARAGDAGRGFAVVADEIRKLAEQSNKFADEITATIVELTDKTFVAVGTMETSKTHNREQVKSLSDTQDKFSGIADAIEEVKTIIEALNLSSVQMLEKKEQIIHIVEQLAAISEENAASSEQASAAVQEQTSAMNQIADASESLARLSEAMQVNISKFKL